MEVKKEELVKAAKELNEVLGLDPQIKIKKTMSLDDLKEKIIEAAGLIEPEDELSLETTNIVHTLTGTGQEFEPEEARNEEEEKEEEEEPEEEKNIKKDRSEAKQKQDQGKGREGKPTKKSVIIQMLEKGATIEQMAEKITDLGIDSDYGKNCKIVKLWLSKMGFDTKKNTIKDNPIFKSKEKEED